MARESNLAVCPSKLGVTCTRPGNFQDGDMWNEWHFLLKVKEKLSPRVADLYQRNRRTEFKGFETGSDPPPKFLGSV